MAVFVALFFQVLFVFFAMAINVGMVVHDKINLQNAVDLAAYYGAARQGEILNQIAHINYQMRQNYKLFVWRFRVLGSMGQDNHPYGASGSGSVGGETPSPPPPGGWAPVYCVTHKNWFEYQRLDPRSNVCRRSNFSLPNIPRLTGGTGFVPGFSNLVSFVDTTRVQFQKQCNEAGIFNWLFAARMLAHYRIDGATRKEMINTLSDLLTQPADSFNDLRGESVRDGVERTLRNNLTAANNNESLRFEYFNSMGQQGCNTRQQWLPEILINPVIRFLDLDGSTNINACNGEAIPNRSPVSRTTGGPANLPSGFNEPDLAARYRAPNAILEQHWLGEPGENTGLHSSVGFEKNPWCMVYSGVSASTTVSKPFSPTGGGVQLQARGFAKPFGGRIGPWYGRTWPAGSPNSVAGGPGEQVDPLLPSRSVGGTPPSSDPNLDLANHSRFPGDQLGMNSERAVSAMVVRGRPAMTQDRAIAWSNYNHLGGGPNLRNTGDSLARDGLAPARQREFELAATAPDAFDIAYYSVEPTYFNNYFSAQTTNGGATLQQDRRIFDFGSSKDGGNGSTQEFNIMQSIQNAQSATGGAINNYLVNNWQHLLTSWHQESAATYGLSDDRFGRCQTPIGSSEFPTYGNCIVGGRVGYSVKNISRDYLQSSDHALGGEGGGSAQVLNPPTF